MDAKRRKARTLNEHTAVFLQTAKAAQKPRVSPEPVARSPSAAPTTPADEESDVTYVTKARSSVGPAKDLSLKYHAMYIDGTGAERMLCGRYKITECDDLGEFPPSSQMCSLCSGKIFTEP